MLWRILAERSVESFIQPCRGGKGGETDGVSVRGGTARTVQPRVISTRKTVQLSHYKQGHKGLESRITGREAAQKL